MSAKEPWIRIEHVREDIRAEARLDADHASERFDRLAFAARLLGRVPLARTTVAIYERHGSLRVERGRALADSQAWAMIGIPPSASREHIALAVAELAGLSRVAFLVDWLARVPGEEG